jgi:23S rRNA (cytidine1920-2'-O)/16S rRNA (cytidine1409-2'-O)-methyltransferase
VARKRVDVLLVERGLADSQAQAQALVMAGRVPGFTKAGAQTDEDTALRVAPPPRFVSRGGEKLAHALAALEVDVTGARCLDIGASTGGFTDCLLQYGAAGVIALDVGYGQLHPKLRADPRVAVLERTNARELPALPFAPDVITCDVSFIGVGKVLPPALTQAAPGWRALVLVKPQFEARRSDVGPGGVVRDPAVHRGVLEHVAASARLWGAETRGVVDSGLPGPKGNREFFLLLGERGEAEPNDALAGWIDAAVAGGRP